MSDQLNPRVGHSDKQEGTQSTIPEQREIGRLSAAGMALTASLPTSSLFNRSLDERLELPPLRLPPLHSSSLPAPSLLKSESSGSEGSKRRKIDNSGWEHTRNAVDSHNLARRSSASLASLDRRESTFSSEQSARDSTQHIGHPMDLYRQNSTTLSSPSEHGVSLFHPSERTGRWAIPAPMPYRVFHNDRGIPMDSRDASISMPHPQRHSFGDWDQRRPDSRNMYGANTHMQYFSENERRVSPSRRDEMDASASPQGSQHSRPSMPSQSSPGLASASPYRMMTLHTSSGLMQIPVDTQAASKHVDEKRRRNAGASARFRERRKRKEVEASATIAKLEMQVKELSRDRDYYRHERDYFRSATLQLTGGDNPSAQAGPSQAHPDVSRNNNAASFGHEPDRQRGYPDTSNTRFAHPPEPSRSWEHGNTAHYASPYSNPTRQLDVRSSALPGPATMSIYKDEPHFGTPANMSRDSARPQAWPPRPYAGAPSAPPANQDPPTTSRAIHRPWDERSTAAVSMTEEDARESRPFSESTRGPHGLHQ